MIPARKLIDTNFRALAKYMSKLFTTTINGWKIYNFFLISLFDFVLTTKSTVTFKNWYNFWFLEISTNKLRDLYPFLSPERMINLWTNLDIEVRVKVRRFINTESFLQSTVPRSLALYGFWFPEISTNKLRDLYLFWSPERMINLWTNLDTFSPRFTSSFTGDVVGQFLPCFYLFIWP